MDILISDFSSFYVVALSKLAQDGVGGTSQDIPVIIDGLFFYRC